MIHENYGLNDLINDVNRKNKINYLFFWGHTTKSKNQLTASCLSQWWGSPFNVDGICYPTAEHWMMAKKAQLFNDTDLLSKILVAKSPTEAKALGRQVQGFQQDLWEQHCFQIVCEGNFHKFSQHNILKVFLLNTGDKVLVEASPVDRIWGIGLSAEDPKASNPRQWRGQNLLGFALMNVREKLKNHN